MPKFLANIPKFLVIAALAALGAAVGAAPAAAALPTGNLLVNPEAEAAPTVAAEGIFGPPQGWAPTVMPEEAEQGPFDACYGGADGESEALDAAVGAAIDGGARYFFAGYDELVTLEQTVPVTSEAAGRALLIGGDFGGWEGQEDHATLEARFLDAAGAVETGAPLTTPGVSAADRGYVTELLPRQASGVVPGGTGMIRFVLTQTREEGISNDGYADNLFATFDATPPARPAAQGDAACPLATTTVTPPPATGSPAPQPSPPAPAPAAPSVRIVKGPAHETSDSAAVFTFTGTAGGSFECSLDGGSWRPCSSGQDFGPAQPGDHLFQVREKLAGKTSAPAGYRWTVDLPRQCVLRVARARVFVYTRKDKARLVIHYTTYRPATVNVTYALTGSKGGLKLGSARGRFQKAGVFRLSERLTAAQIAKVRAAKSFRVRFRIPATPKSCGRYYAKRLTIPRKVSGQTVWFQSDSRFARGS
jgi:hypothetical protein